MTTSIFRIRFEAWLNRIYLTQACDNYTPNKLARGVVVFMAYRRLLEQDLGFDYLEELHKLSKEDCHNLLLHFKGLYIVMRRNENSLRDRHSGDLNDDVFSDKEASYFSCKIAASIAIQLLSGHLASKAQIGSLRILYQLIKTATPMLPDAHVYCKYNSIFQLSLCATLGVSPSLMSREISRLTADELLTPLAPLPNWMRLLPR